jgi:hypothetical protein
MEGTALRIHRALSSVKTLVRELQLDYWRIEYAIEQCSEYNYIDSQGFLIYEMR